MHAVQRVGHGVHRVHHKLHLSLLLISGVPADFLQSCKTEQIRLELSPVQKCSNLANKRDPAFIYFPKNAQVTGLVQVLGWLWMEAFIYMQV